MALTDPDTNQQRQARIEQLLRDIDVIQMQAEQLAHAVREKSLAISRELALMRRA